MTSELSPGGSNVKMTKAQIKEYLKKLREAERIAKQKIKDAKENGEYYEGGISEDELANMLKNV